MIYAYVLFRTAQFEVLITYTVNSSSGIIFDGFTHGLPLLQVVLGFSENFRQKEYFRLDILRTTREKVGRIHTEEARFLEKNN